MNETKLTLGGTVRPYFGRSRRTRPTDEAAPAVAAATPATPVAPTSPQPPAAPSKSEPSPALPSSAIAAHPKSVVHKACRTAGWDAMEMGDDIQVDVAVGAGRTQIVSIRFDRRDPDGRPLLSFASLCGAADERNALPLLRFNAKLVYGAFAVERRANHEDLLVLRYTALAESCTPAHLRCVIEEIARRADKIEGKLSSSDQY